MVGLINVGWSILTGLLLFQSSPHCLAAGRQDDQSPFKSATIEYEHFFNHGTTANPKSNSHKIKDHLGSGKLENEVLKSKVEVLGEVLKHRVQALRHVPGQKVELVFLVDSSASVGAENFFNELKFVKKLLADFTVSAEAARVAVVTFSSKNRVVRHIDHVSPFGLTAHRELAANGAGDPRHKCRLLEQELPAIGYTGGGTYTLGALLEAQSVLEGARPEAVKAVFLITDGYSNGGDPRPAAKRLREQGVRVFTFGIRNGNVKELYDMASEPAQEHSYIVDSFEEFEALARRALHEDLQTGSYLPQVNRSACDKLCKDQSECCHPSAECTCGTHTGHYACLCPAGHYGTGLKDDCHPCPGGTYRSDGGPGDLKSCRPCPDENHISPAGSTSADQCQCPRGYIPEDGGRTCQLLACPKLEPPANGYFVKQSCNSVFNGACGIRCNGGYKLIGSSIRLCQENGTWSGEEAVCQMRSCGPVPAPKNGRIECTSDSYIIDSECTFSCDVGFTLVGSRKRVCLPIGYWDGLPAFCKPVFCNPLPKVMNGTWTPSKCPQAKMRYGEQCNATCATGFELRGPEVRRCSEQGSWTEEEVKTRCVDVTPPEITCPADAKLDALDGENFATYSWEPPVVSDNSGTPPDVISVPAVTEQPMRFRIGNATVAYKALDRRGNQAECSFQVMVTDSQPPTVDQCESPPTFLLRDRNTSVVWDEPVFSDNSGRPPTVDRSHDPGRFPLGESEVIYTATDESGNNNTCTLIIRVQEHACHLPVDPIHGQANCSQQPDAVYCSLTCHDGYAFAMPPPRNYFCAYDGQWLPADSPLPFPDCSVTTHSDALIQDGLLRLTNVGDGSEEDKICQDPFLMSQMEGHFKRRLAARLNEICGDNMICQVDDLQAECRQLVAESDGAEDQEPVTDSMDWEQTNEITRTRRRRVVRRSFIDWSEKTQRVKRNATSSGFNSAKGKSGKSKKNSGTTLELRFKVFSRFAQKLNATDGTSRTIQPSSLNLTQDMILSELNQLRAMLTESALSGEFNVNYTAGQLLNVFDVQFEGDVDRPKFSCPAGSIPVKADNSTNEFARCVYCPVGTFFNVVNEVCESCSQGSYQPEEGQLSCLVCPNNTSTKVVNAKRSDDCQAQCLAGSYSPTGLEPCSTCPQGTYQTEYSQRQCLPCPSGSTTWRRGSRRLEDCKFVCARGLVSETGLAPCFPCPAGFYQPLDGQKFCIRCPRRAPYTPGIAAVNRIECLRVRPSMDGNDVNGTEELPEAETTEEFEQATLLEVNECFSLPCQNGGQCRTLDFGYVCDCPAGYTGMQCQTDVDECSSSPCLNGATCLDGVDSFQCQCPTGFTGDLCQTDIDECLSGPCHEGATCVDKTMGYICVCPPGMAGPRCELDVDECLSGPCQNGGTCYDRLANYTCVCHPGWAGKLCEQAVDECLSQPCLNGATCEDLVGHFICHCPTGYDGLLCDNDVDECQPEPCASGSTCINRLGSFACSCPPGVVGSTCDTTVNPEFSLEFTSAGKLDYAVWEGGLRTHSKPLGQLSLCAWIKTTDQQNYGTVFSYATDEEANSLTLTDYSGFVLYVNGAKVVTDVTANDGRWHLICATWSSSPDGHWRIYSDGELKDSGFGLATNSTVPPDGTVILGQEQDVRSGGFSNAESFVGLLYGVELWDSVLDDQQIDGLTLSCHPSGNDSSEHRGNLITWADFKHGLRGGIRVEESLFCRGCSDPIPPRHGAVSVQGNEAVYVCEQGYVLTTPSPRRPCLVHGGWSGPDPDCQRVSCGFPGYILNGLVNGTNYVYGNTVSYNCTRGFRLSGSGLRTCEGDGQWSGSPPECIPVTCEPPTAPVNGSQIEPVAQDVYAVGDKVSFQCAAGFRLDGSYSLTCQDEGQWDDVLPVCQPLACSRPPYVEHGIVTNGVAEILPEDLPHFLVPGSILTFSCLFGYQLESSAEVQCSHDGYWIGKIPKCVPIECGTPPEISYANVQLSRPNNNRVGSMASYVCQPGYEHYGPTELECTESGTWLDRTKQATLPVCMVVDCGPLPTINNGAVYAEEQTFGSKAPVTCYSGYKLIGPSSWIECGADYRWTIPPQCLAVACAEAPPVRNGSQSAAGPFVAGEEVRYACQDGFRSSASLSDVLTCLEDGSWMGTVPECLPEQCPSPDSIDNGSWVYTSAVEGETVNYDDQTVFYTGAEVLYSCRNGYVLEGGSRRRCAGLVGWLPQGLPSCHNQGSLSGITCPALDNPDHGTIVVESFEPGKLAHFECDTGFQASATGGPADLVCNSDGTWSVNNAESDVRQPFRCEEVNCGEPEEPVNGSVTFTSTNFGSKALFRCDQGFVLSGSQQRTCGSEGSWIGGSRPRCLARTCSMPDIIEHGYIGFEVGGSATSLNTGSVILYDCEEGYQLVGVRERSCLPTGDWTDEEPSCHQILCNRLSGVLEHGTATGAEEHAYGSVVQFACDPGYELDGPERLTCEDDENWNGIPPTCRPVECPNPGLVANVIVSLQQSNAELDAEVYHFGDVLVYTCRKGYAVTKPTNGGAAVERRCLADGSWSSKPPVCSRVVCPAATIPQHGFTSRPVPSEMGPVNETEQGALVGEIIQYGCKKGYQLAKDGPKSAKCLEAGKWNVSEPPTCQLVRCSQPPAITNAKLDGNEKKEYSYLDHVEYVCDFGFRMTGEGRLACSSLGDWGDQIPTCMRAVCPTVDVPEDVIATPVYPAPDELKTSRQPNPFAIQFACQHGHDLVGSALSECTSTGEWNHPPPACVPWPCKSPPVALNGQIQSTEIRPDMIVAHVRCDPGFQLVGTDLTCGPSGVWKGKPQCQPQLCVLPKQLKMELELSVGLIFSEPLKDTYRYSEQIQFGCQTGYTLDESQTSTFSCRENGEWDEQKIPTCSPIHCSDVQIPQHGSVSETSSLLDSRITFGCHEGYQLEGEEQITCLPDGTWSNSLPVCVARSCGEPPSIENGWMAVRGTGVNDTVSYSCQPGYRLSGGDSRTCLSNGLWSGEDLACDPVVCPVPKAPEHGTWTVGGFIPGSTIRFECLPGFTLIGSATITCLTDKSWSDQPPSCQQITCPSLRDPDHGTVQLIRWLSDNQEMNNEINQRLTAGYRSTAHYTCDRGYQLFGPEQRICTEQGKWSERGPQCQRVWCPEPQAPTQGFVMGTGRQFGDRVRYACSAGYRLIGADDSTCLADGIWSALSPQCEASPDLRRTSSRRSPHDEYHGRKTSHWNSAGTPLSRRVHAGR
ncbi:putative Sushi [Daphnia magna]|uniref:Putative Sushi n=1 Tax=Daphnia magna TaxID=35525 RepID=A0A0P5Y854_9CRUS|nr:putative Sushi [Daphnia magna]